jgi:hypothetical protein
VELLKLGAEHGYGGGRGDCVRDVPAVGSTSEHIARSAALRRGRGDRVRAAGGSVEGVRSLGLGAINHDGKPGGNRGDGCTGGDEAVDTRDPIDIAGGQRRALADRDAHRNGLDRIGIIHAENLGTVVHQGIVIVVADVAIKKWRLFEIHIAAFIDVLIQHRDERIAVVTSLLMLQTEGVAYLMGDHAGVAAIQDLNGLRAAEHTQRRFADRARPGGSHELNVIGLRGSRNDLKRRIVIPNLNGIEDALWVRNRGVDCVVKGSVGPKTTRCRTWHDGHRCE